MYFNNDSVSLFNRLSLHFFIFRKMKKVDRFLNSGILIEILSHVPAKDLLSLKRVCKEWHHVISSRCFVEAQLQRTKEEALNGFIFQEKFMWCNEDIKTISYISVEVTTKGGSKVNQKVFDFLPEDVVMMASCKGGLSWSGLGLLLTMTEIIVLEAWY